MTAIASYYASVGVGIDPKSLQNVQRYLDTIQAKMVKFQKDAFKTSNLSLRLNNFTVNQASLRRTINTAVANQRIRLDNVAVGNIRISSAALTRQINAAIGASSTASGTGTPIRLRNFHVSQKELMAAINKAVNVEGRSSRIRIGALLSQSSLTEMRNQVRQAINQLVVNPTINPRVRVVRTGQGQGIGQGASAGSGGSGTSPNRYTTRDPRSMNPWHNPMMIGGSAGAFMRYGMFSLPFVAGAYGLNALSQNMTRLEGHNIMLTTSAQSPLVAREQFDVVNRISEGLGLKTSDILPFYAQMFAGARGTTLEQELPASFQGFMEYAMAMGVNDQQLEGGIRAISQAISKGAIYSEEWRQQLTCVVMIMQAVVKPI